GRPMRWRCSRISAMQLSTIAVVTAISRISRATLVLLRAIARRIGPISITTSSLELQLQSRRDAAGAPGRVEAGEQSGRQRQQEGDREGVAVGGEGPRGELAARRELLDPLQGERRQ